MGADGPGRRPDDGADRQVGLSPLDATSRPCDAAGMGIRTCWGIARSTTASTSDAACYSVECDDDDVLDGPAFERTRADVARELRSARCTPGQVYRWARRGLVTGGDRCEGPTMRDAIQARARAWSEHVRSVVESRAALVVGPVSGEC